MEFITWLNDIVNSNQITLETAAFRLMFSVLVGGIIGFERQRSRHSAGFRTFTLISVGSTIMMLVSIFLPQEFMGVYTCDPTRVAGQVVTGIGFLGAGAIMQSKGTIRGMTTAASIWIVSALGLAIGAGLYMVSAMGLIVTLFVLINLAKFERRVMVEWSVKNLTIVINQLQFDNKSIEAILKKHGVSVIDLHLEQDLKNDTTHLHYSVSVKLGTDYETLFNELRSIFNTSNVKLWV